MRKTMMMLVAIVGLAAFGCSAEEAPCADDDCKSLSNPDDGSDGDGTDPQPPACEQLCGHLDFECNVTDETFCMRACAEGAFTAAEMVCLAATCGDGLLHCLDESAGRGPIEQGFDF